MSVFRVKVGRTAGPEYSGMRGSDGKAGGGGKTVYIEGPRLIKRILTEGSTFTDSNYYKRFCEPQATADTALLELVTDDGSTYSDATGDSTSPKVFNLDDANLSVTFDGQAVFAQITNNGGAVRLRLNGSADAIIDLAAATTQVFNTGDLVLSSIEVMNDSGVTGVDIQIIASIKTATLT